MKLLAIIVAALSLSACFPSLQDVDKAIERCKAQGGEPETTRNEFSNRVSGVMCMKHGGVFYEF